MVQNCTQTRFGAQRSVQCPLSDSQVREICERMLGQVEVFDTHAFIAACPQSGGRKSGEGCAQVRQYGRGGCGRRLAQERDAADGILAQCGKVSPAKWRRRTEDDVTSGSWAPTRPRPGERAMRQQQIDWKLTVAGIEDEGEYDGCRDAVYFPLDRWTHNLLPMVRDAVLRHVAEHRIALNDYRHHVMSSQAFAFNLAGPFLESPDLLTPVIEALLPDELARHVSRVTRVELEVDGDTNYFREPGRRGEYRTSADIGIWWEDEEHVENLLLVEVKFTEEKFGQCDMGHGAGSPCRDRGSDLVASDGRDCPLVRRRDRAYWSLMRDVAAFRRDAFAGVQCCPFLDEGYQLMRNQLLAAAMESDPKQKLGRADFAVLVHDSNSWVYESLTRFAGERDVRVGWPKILRRPDRFHSWQASQWLAAAAESPALGEWVRSMRERYFPGGVRLFPVDSGR